MAWELNGNAGTDPAHTFLGTTDNKPLVIQPEGGNVGIGTRTPDTRLNINSNAPAAQAVLVVSDENADTRVGVWSGFGSGENPPAIIYTHDLRFGVGRDFSSGQDFSEAMRITQSGNIGIGTTNPSSKVEIAAQDGLAVTGFQPFITLRDANAGARCLIQCVDGHIGLIPNNPGNVAALFLQANTGRVGIGTTQPEELLHVVGDVHMVNNNTGTGIGLEVDTSLNTALIVTTTAPDSTAFFVNQRGSGNIMTGRNAQNAEVFRVLNNGDVQVRGVTLACDMNVKDNFSSVDTRAVLEKLAGMPIQEWNYKTDPTSVRHIGPASQDFRAAFELNGDDETNIASVDAQGISLAAIQGLNEKLNAENAQLRTTLADLERRLAALESALPKS
jgi:hypothetical protein